MIRLNVIPLLEAQGKTKYWLYKQLGMSYQNFNNMICNRTKSIRYELILIKVKIEVAKRGREHPKALPASFCRLDRGYGLPRRASPGSQ